MYHSNFSPPVFLRFLLSTSSSLCSVTSGRERSWLSSISSLISLRFPLQLTRSATHSRNIVTLVARCLPCPSCTRYILCVPTFLTHLTICVWEISNISFGLWVYFFFLFRLSLRLRRFFYLFPSWYSQHPCLDPNLYCF